MEVSFQTKGEVKHEALVTIEMMVALVVVRQEKGLMRWLEIRTQIMSKI